MTLPHLIRPFTGTPTITQVFGHNWPGVEPQDYLYADGTIGFIGTRGARAGWFHTGVDYALPEGTPLLAPGDGRITWTGWDTTGFGLLVVIDHGAYRSLLGHTRNILHAQGHDIKQGVPVALSGTTGNSKGPHVHWSVVRNSDSHYCAPSLFLGGM